MPVYEFVYSAEILLLLKLTASLYLKSHSIICGLEIRTINFTEFTGSGEQHSIGPFIMTLS